MSQWYPIDTMPKDGIAYAVVRLGDSRDGAYPYASAAAFSDDDDCFYYERGRASAERLAGVFTHWTHLPSPPDSCAD